MLLEEMDTNGEEMNTIEEEEVSGQNENEKEVLSASLETECDDIGTSASSEKDCDEIDTNECPNEAGENFEVMVEEPKVGMTFDTVDEAYLYYSSFAKERGFGVAKKSRRMGANKTLRHVTFQCSRGGKARVRTTNPVKPRPQTKIECPARLNFSVDPDGKCRLNRVNLEHNHIFTPGKSKFYKSNRVLHGHVKRRLINHHEAGIKLHKTYDSLQIQAGGHEDLPYFEKDCRNYVDRWRRSLLKEGDAEAMYNYFMKMQADNSDFFFAMDLDDDERLRNVFWADARSRAAFKEFGDVVTFDTTYLVNKYDMPFAPFVGVNHHGQSILLGCGLISREDTKSFSWLFKTWMKCMWDCAPKAIITDQCMAMKNAIEEVFPNIRHRWCIWHILKKVPQKLGACKKYKSISWCLHNAVYDSLSKQEFEKSWDSFIKKYQLEDNEWLNGLYLERHRWVPAFLKDVFWAGMSSTQRSESMNAYFDGFINSKTTLKEFVGQYANALAKKVENEKNEDMKSSESYIPSLVEDELEEQFHSSYTNAKAKEFQDQFVGKLKCKENLTKVGDVWSEYEVKEKMTFGEGEEKRKKMVSFTVDFNVETNESNCNCRLFEFRGMVCRHQLLVWHKEGVERVPDKYVLKRWRKDVKRCHSKIRINYDHSSNTIEARRHDNMCKLSNEVADLAEDCQEKYDKVMGRLRDLKKELIETRVGCGSNVVSGTPTNEDGVVPSKESVNIVDPVVVRRRGRPEEKRKIGPVEKIGKKKKEQSNKSLCKKKDKEVGDIADGHVLGTQQGVVNVNSYPSYVGQLMWQNMMSHSMQTNMAQVGTMLSFPPNAAQGGTISFTPNTAQGGTMLSFPPNMAQGGTMLSFSPNMAQGGAGFNQLVNNFPTSQWGEGQQSFTEMMNARDDSEL